LLEPGANRDRPAVHTRLVDRVEDLDHVRRVLGAGAVRTPLIDCLRKIHERHRVGLRVDAIASIALGLFTLYAVAAVLSRDRNGRRLALLTAVLGIVYQLGELPLSIQIPRERAAEAGPLLAEINGAGGEAAGRWQAEFAVGVGWCALLLVYFGGPRGRELYGLPRRPS